jgi:heme/copper-type cytochrome/quinol oxidase subunit 2
MIVIRDSTSFHGTHRIHLFVTIIPVFAASCLLVGVYQVFKEYRNSEYLRGIAKYCNKLLCFDVYGIYRCLKIILKYSRRIHLNV